MENRLIEIINELILPLGYEVVHLEIQSHRQKTLRVFIDFSVDPESKTIGIEDCVNVTRALDEPLDAMPEVEKLMHGTYELEVSSPGVDRPLRQEKDFVRFSGREVRIHTFRPLTAEELGNAAYSGKNPRQKNFFGTLNGFENEKVKLVISSDSSATGKPAKKSNKKNKEADAATGAEISIPLPLIAKANLEPKFDFDSKEAVEI